MSCHGTVVLAWMFATGSAGAQVFLETSISPATPTTIEAVDVTLSIKSDDQKGIEVRLEGPLRLRLTGGPGRADMQPVPSACDGRSVLAVGSFPLIYGSPTRDHPLVTQQVINDCFGRLAAGDYSLQVKAYVWVTKEAASQLPGAPVPRTSPDFVSTEGRVLWQLPEQVVTLKIREADRKDVESVLQAFRRSTTVESLHSIPTEKWVSLVLIDSDDSWALLAQHAGRIPSKAANVMKGMLLTSPDRRVAVRRAKRLLSRAWNDASNAAIAVIEARGKPADAEALARISETTSDVTLRRVAFFAAMKLLHREPDSELRQRQVTSRDIAALKSVTTTIPSED